MASGSYFTIYRKQKSSKLSEEALSALKNEYFLSNKNGILGPSTATEEEMKKDLPLLMYSRYKADPMPERPKSNTYYDADGIAYDKLLEFHFGSSFTCLKEHFSLNPYTFSKSSVIVAKPDAEKMLQAVEYILGGEYSKKFEDTLSNDYVQMLGSGYSVFDNRFRQSSKPVYVDNDDRGYIVRFGDCTYDAEIDECDDDVVFALKRMRACILAYLNAEECTWDDEELVLEYSAY